MTKNLLLAGLCVSLLLSVPMFSQNGRASVGAVYTMTNAASGNNVLVFDRAPDGTLTSAGAVPTGGNGAGAPLASQGSIALSANGRWLLVSNAGSDSVSVFSVRNGQLTLTGSFPSGGHYPYSIAINGDLVYVLNAGAAAGPASNVTGFRLDQSGSLTPIAGSTSALSGPFVDPAQVGFNPDGTFLVVTERGTSLIDVFPVQSDGLLGARVTSPSAGLWPYGFGFGIRNQLIVSEAVLMQANASSMSSYVLNADGTLTAVTAATPTHQTAACWVVVTPGGRYTYTTDALSKAISGYSIDRTGAIDLLNANGITATTAVGFTADEALSDDSRYLYVLSLLGSGITAYRVEADGSMVQVGVSTLPGLPSGLVVR